MKPKGAADGQQVNIPVPLLYRWLLKKDSGSLLRILRLKYSRWDERGKTRDPLTLRYDTNKYYLTIHASEKRSLVKIGPVPKPTQVDGLSILR